MTSGFMGSLLQGVMVRCLGNLDTGTGYYVTQPPQ